MKNIINADLSVSEMPVGISLSYPIDGGNPFMKYGFFTKRVKEKSFKGKGIIEVENVSEAECEVLIKMKQAPIVIDVEQYYKLFKISIGIMLDMKQGELKMFVYIIGLLSKESDIVNIDIDAYCNTYGYNRRIAMQSVRSMIRLRVIARTNKRGLYFVNSHLFFEGDRVKKYGEYNNETKNNYK